MKTFIFRLAAPALLLGTALAARAQSPYVGESLNYSRLQFGGPARTQGIAGANVALGADFGNLSSNPAGLGLFRKSEVHFSPGVGIGSAEATGLTAQKNSFHVGSIGGVFTNRLADDDNSSDWRGGSFALGFSRVADFNTSFQYAGTVADSMSFFQYLREPGRTGRPERNAFGTAGYQAAINDIDEQVGPPGSTRAPVYTSIDGLAFGAYLTDIRSTRIRPGRPVAADSLITLARTGPITQAETVTTSGSVSQLDFGYGGSYKDRLFVGGAIGIVSSNRRQTRSFSEADAGGRSFVVSDDTRTTGRGFNARIGVIYRLNDVVRLGASVQTPTFFQLDDTYNQSITSTFSPPLVLSGQAGTMPGTTVKIPPGAYAYALTTPFRANGGVALTAGKIGFLTADVEYVGYGQARLSGQPDNENGDDNSFTSENQGIKNAFRSTVNVRLGAEARLDVFRLRGGYARYGDPNAGGSGLDRSQQFYTVGLGLRQQNFFLDVAGVYTTYQQLYSPYSLLSGQEPVVNIANTRYTTTVTAGFTF